MIDVQGLTRHYGARAAIADLTFSVPSGQMAGLLGPNGAGKSTTLRILSGYLRATSGTVRVAGWDVARHSREARRQIGYLPETTPLLDEMRVGRFLDAMCRLHGVPSARRTPRVDHALRTCGLTELRQEIIGDLSLGARRRVGLARAVVHDPSVLVLDEPTAGLDPAEAREVEGLLRGLAPRHTVVLSGRSLLAVKELCDRVLVLEEGRLVADAAPGDLDSRLAGAPGRDPAGTAEGEAS